MAKMYGLAEIWRERQWQSNAGSRGEGWPPVPLPPPVVEIPANLDDLSEAVSLATLNHRWAEYKILRTELTRRYAEGE